MRERQIRQKVGVLGVARWTYCTSNCLHDTLIVHKPSSKFTPYEFKLRLSSPFLCALYTTLLHSLYHQNNFSGKDTNRPQTIHTRINVLQILRNLQFSGLLNCAGFFINPACIYSAHCNASKTEFILLPTSLKSVKEVIQHR